MAPAFVQLVPVEEAIKLLPGSVMVSPASGFASVLLAEISQTPNGVDPVNPENSSVPAPNPDCVAPGSPFHGDSSAPMEPARNVEKTKPDGQGRSHLADAPIEAPRSHESRRMLNPPLEPVAFAAPLPLPVAPERTRDAQISSPASSSERAPAVVSEWEKTKMPEEAKLAPMRVWFPAHPPVPAPPEEASHGVPRQPPGPGPKAEVNEVARTALLAEPPASVEPPPLVALRRAEAAAEEALFAHPSWTQQAFRETTWMVGTKRDAVDRGDAPPVVSKSIAERAVFASNRLSQLLDPAIPRTARLENPHGGAIDRRAMVSRPADVYRSAGEDLDARLPLPRDEVHAQLAPTTLPPAGSALRTTEGQGSARQSTGITNEQAGLTEGTPAAHASLGRPELPLAILKRPVPSEGRPAQGLVGKGIPDPAGVAPVGDGRVGQPAEGGKDLAVLQANPQWPEAREWSALAQNGHSRLLAKLQPISALLSSGSDSPFPAAPTFFLEVIPDRSPGLARGGHELRSPAGQVEVPLGIPSSHHNGGATREAPPNHPPLRDVLPASSLTNPFRVESSPRAPLIQEGRNKGVDSTTKQVGKGYSADAPPSPRTRHVGETPAKTTGAERAEAPVLTQTLGAHAPEGHKAKAAAPVPIVESPLPPNPLLGGEALRPPSEAPIEHLGRQESPGTTAPHHADTRPWGEVRMPHDRPVDVAQLIERAGRSEMRIELRTDALGVMAIRAVLKENQLGAAIGVERPDAQAILVSELPRLEQNLADRNVRLEHVEVFQGMSGGGPGEGGNHQANPSQTHHHRWVPSAPNANTVSADSLISPEPDFADASFARLSVRV